MKNKDQSSSPRHAQLRHHKIISHLSNVKKTENKNIKERQGSKDIINFDKLKLISYYLSVLELGYTYATNNASKHYLQIYVK